MGKPREEAPAVPREEAPTGGDRPLFGFFRVKKKRMIMEK